MILDEQKKEHDIESMNKKGPIQFTDVTRNTSQIANSVY